MAQIIPPITSLPIDSSAAPSVEDIQDRLPSICVDYLSHDWSEEDVWASWRNMTRHKHEIANGVRLENASWRTWQKQRNNLKTISPETLNWLKDSDVTWLYGPLHTANVEPVRPLKVSSTGERLGLEVSGGLGPRPSKPILKHRTLSEMLSITTPSSPVLEADTPEGEVDGMNEARPLLTTTKSDTNIFTTRPGMAIRRTSPTLPMGTFPGGSGAGAAGGAGGGGGAGGLGAGGDRSPNAAGTRTPIEGVPTSGKEKKHISFNTFVEQCIAVDDPSENQQSAFAAGGGGGDDDSDDDMLEMRSHRSSSSKSSRPSFSRHSSGSSTRSSAYGGEPLTIAKIAPTMLKTQSYANSESLPQMVYQPPPQYLSPQASSSRSASTSPQADMHLHSPVGPSSYTSTSSTVSTGSTSSGGTAGRKWDDDDGQPYDYFGGPDRDGGNNNTARAQAQNIPQQQQRGPAPVVGQPPQQPKWRQGPAQSAAQTQNQASYQSPSQAQTQSHAPGQTASQGTAASAASSYDSTTSASSSTSSSSANLGSSAGITSPPQPARSILKTRPATNEVPLDVNFDSGSPPSSYFNYNPSAATGIGGMRAAQYLDQNQSQGSGSGGLPGQTGSPLVSPATEERGRRTSRGGTGTSQYDRSISRGTNSSTASQSPMSPGPGHGHGHGAASAGGSGIGSGQAAQAGVPKKATAQAQAKQQAQQQAQQAHVQSQANQAQNAANTHAQAQAQREKNESEMEIDHDESPASAQSGSNEASPSPERGASTPTPHSSPQILFRPLQDTSPASLPHHSTSLSTPFQMPSTASQSVSARPASTTPPPTSQSSSPEAPLSPYASRNPSSPVDSHLPRAHSPHATSPPGGPPLAVRNPGNAGASAGAPAGRGRSMGGKATTAAVGTMAAAPHIYQNQPPKPTGTPGQATSGEAVQAQGGQAQEQARRNADHLPQPKTALQATPSTPGGSLGPSAGTSSGHPNQHTLSSANPHANANRWVRPTGAYPDTLPHARGDDDDEGDGSSIMGRAANIASTARDLFGALWYGAQNTGSGASASQGQALAQDQAQLQAQAQQSRVLGHAQGQATGSDRREEQQAQDHRVAEQSARRGGKHTRGKSIG